jgi:hypothetical protein
VQAGIVTIPGAARLQEELLLRGPLCPSHGTRSLSGPQARLRRLSSSIATSHRFDLGELWIKSGFRSAM